MNKFSKFFHQQIGTVIWSIYFMSPIVRVLNLYTQWEQLPQGKQS